MYAVVPIEKIVYQIKGGARYINKRQSWKISSAKIENQDCNWVPQGENVMALLDMFWSVNRGAALDTAGTAVAVPEFPIISSVLGHTFHFVGKPTNLVGFWSLCFPIIKCRPIQVTFGSFRGCFQCFSINYDDVEHTILRYVGCNSRPEVK